MAFLLCHFRFVKSNLTPFAYKFILSHHQHKCTLRHRNQFYWKKNMYVNRCSYFRRYKCDRERIGEGFKLSRLYNQNTMHVECKTKVIPGATVTSSKLFRNTWATYWESIKSRNYSKQPYSEHLLWRVLM